MSRKGFTLLEVVMVVVILLILAGLAFGLLGYVESARVTATSGRVNTLGIEVATVAKLKGFPPATLGELIPRLPAEWVKEGKVVDAWERPIEYRVDGKQFQLWSCGRDGISGTDDDLRYARK